MAGAVVRTCHRIEVVPRGPGHPAELLDRRWGIGPGRARRLLGRTRSRGSSRWRSGSSRSCSVRTRSSTRSRLAIADARGPAPFGGELALAFDLALRAGRIGRTWHPARPTSIADLAVRRGEALAGDLQRPPRAHRGQRRGWVGWRWARRVRGRGGRPRLPNAGRAVEAAARLHVGRWPFDPGDALAEAAVVLVALAGAWTLESASLRALAAGPVVVDLSMPGALSADAVVSLGARFLGIDDLATRPDDGAEDGSGEDLATRRYRRAPPGASRADTRDVRRTGRAAPGARARRGPWRNDSNRADRVARWAVRSRPSSARGPGRHRGDDGPPDRRLRVLRPALEPFGRTAGPRRMAGPRRGRANEAGPASRHRHTRERAGDGADDHRPRRTGSDRGRVRIVPDHDRWRRPRTRYRLGRVARS